MKIAVITPTIIGRESLLTECIGSVKSQDTGGDFCHFIGVDYDGIGCGQTRNRIVAEVPSEFDWLAFLDDDDILLPHHLRMLSMVSDSSDIIYSDCRTEGWEKTWESGPLHLEKLWRRNYIPVTVFMRRRVFEAVHGFSKVFAEDWDLWKRLSIRGYRFTYVPEVTWVYRQVQGHSRMLVRGC